MCARSSLSTRPVRWQHCAGRQPVATPRLSRRHRAPHTRSASSSIPSSSLVAGRHTLLYRRRRRRRRRRVVPSGFFGSWSPLSLVTGAVGVRVPCTRFIKLARARRERARVVLRAARVCVWQLRVRVLRLRLRGCCVSGPVCFLYWPRRRARCVRAD